MPCHGACRLSPFEVGQIKAHSQHGLSTAEIAAEIIKADGATAPSREAVRQVLLKLKANPGWTGERKAGSGRPRSTSKKLDTSLCKAVMARRGKAKITSAILRKSVPGAGVMSTSTIRRRLAESGLEWLRRRRKTLVTADAKNARLAWASWVLRCRRGSLKRWAYSDGTVFYLDRTEAEHEGTKRAALGGYVWRQSDKKDALYSDCVGPSSYYKGQGIPVRVWGLLTGGRLHIAVLREGHVMNRWRYAEIVNKCFTKWLAGVSKPLLVQDYERCLRCDEPLAACRSAGIHVLAQHPSHSPDLNAIENAWALLRNRLGATEPTAREHRSSFIKRLRTAVLWVNRNNKSSLVELSNNQQDRATEVIRLDGARTHW